MSSFQRLVVKICEKFSFGTVLFPSKEQRYSGNVAPPGNTGLHYVLNLALGLY